VHPAYLISGADDFLAQTAVKMLTDAILTTDQKEFNLAVFYGNSAGDLDNSLATMPVFASKRVTVVRQAQDLKEKHLESVFRHLASAPSDSCLILWAEKLDQRSKFYLGLQKTKIAHIECSLPKGQELTDWIQEFTQKLGKRVDPQAMSRLSNIPWPSLRDLAGELEQLALLIGSEPVIKLKHIDEMGETSFIAGKFQLQNDVSKGQTAKAMVTLRNLEHWNVKSNAILNDMQQLIQRLWLVEPYYRKRVPYATAASELNMVPYPVKMAFDELASGISARALEDGLLLCHQAEVNIKREGQDDWLEVRMLVTQLSELLRRRR